LGYKLSPLRQICALIWGDNNTTPSSAAVHVGGSCWENIKDLIF